MTDFNFEDFSTDRLKLLCIKDHPEMHKEFVGLHPSQQDVEELDAACGDWRLAVARSTETSGAHACVYKGKVRALFGFNRDELVYAYYPWLISDGVIQKEIPLEFHRVCRRILEHAMRCETEMLNFAAEDAERYAWLEGLGFTFSPTRTWLRGVPFRKFSWKPEV